MKIRYLFVTFLAIFMLFANTSFSFARPIAATDIEDSIENQDTIATDTPNATFAMAYNVCPQIEEESIGMGSLPLALPAMIAGMLGGIYIERKNKEKKIFKVS